METKKLQSASNARGKTIENNLKLFGFFENDLYSDFLLEKVKKVHQAVYLVTGHIKDIEPIKWRLRRLSANIFEYAVDLNCPIAEENSIFVNRLVTNILYVLHYLKLAGSIGLISENNSSLIINELELILESFGNDNERSFLSGKLLDKDFFKQKGQGYDSPISTKNDGQVTINVSLDNIEKRDKRQEQILQVLKDATSQGQAQNGLTVRDFVNVIKGLGEKTMQRELALMLKNGLIEKKGERRWSRYTVKN